MDDWEYDSTNELTFERDGMYTWVFVGCATRGMRFHNKTWKALCNDDYLSCKNGIIILTDVISTTDFKCRQASFVQTQYAISTVTK